MYEIWLGADGDELIGESDSAAGALAELEAIAEATTRQLLANGEGATSFVLHLTLRDAATGDVEAAFCALG